MGDKKKNKKKINPIVLVVVLVGLGFFVFYEEEPVVAPPVLKKIQKVAKKDIDAAKTEEPVVTETPDATKTEEPVVTETPDATITEEPVVTETPDATKTEEPVVTETPDANKTEEPVVTETPDATKTEEPVVTETPTSPNEDDSVISEAQTPVDSTIEKPVIGESSDDSIDNGPSIDEPVVTDIAPTSFDSVDGQETGADETSMTDKILEDLEKQVKKNQPVAVKTEYVSPPDYEYRGRGLVYNCAGKHWACVDGPSYKVCENNFSSTSYQKKTIECYPFNIYETKKGCELMQNRVVSSSAKTDFCKGN